jgi:methylsterol monooxygenase
MAFVNNFSTSFRWCDRIFGTDDKYRAYRARLNAAKKAGMTPEEYARMETKLNEQYEAEGQKAEAEAEKTGFGGAWSSKKVKVQ